MYGPPFDLPSSPHAQLTPDGTTPELASPPDGAHGCFITVKTADAYVTFDGTVPSATNGLCLADAVEAVYFPFAKPVRALSSAAASVVDILWIK